MTDDKRMVVRTPSRAPKGVIELPEEMPPPLVEQELLGPGPAVETVTPELVTEAEQRYEESKKARPPARTVDSAPMMKDSIVVPIELNAKTFWGFLEALSRITVQSEEYPILAGVKIHFLPGEDPRLLLEAQNGHIWAAASMAASGGREEFKAVLPLDRTLSILKLLSHEYSTIEMGLGENKIHVGNFSFPFWGHPDHFPKKPLLEPVRCSVVMSTAYAFEIPKRVGVAAGAEGEDDFKEKFRGSFLDLEKRVAVGTNGHRMHLLELPMMQVDLEEEPGVKAVRVEEEVYRYLQAVEDREWTGFRVGDTKLMVGHEDFGLIARHDRINVPKWWNAVPIWEGDWRLNKDAFLSAVKEASLIPSVGKVREVNLAFDLHARNVTVIAEGPSGDVFQKQLSAHADGKLLPFLRIKLNAIYLLDALDVCNGNSVRLGVGREDNPMTVMGDDNCFKAVIMPRREYDAQTP